MVRLESIRMKRKCATIAEALERLIAEFGDSAYRLGKLAGVPASSISNILSGKRKPNFETMQRLVQAAGKDWCWLKDNLQEIELPKPTK